MSLARKQQRKRDCRVCLCLEPETPRKPHPLYLEVRAISIALMLSLLAGSGAHATSAARKPVVFIPGILGSQLEDEHGVKVWGPLIRSLRGFARLEFPRDSSQDRIRATALVEELEFLGPFQVDQYSGIIRTLEELGFKRDSDLFLFPYDWRQSNFDSARDLDAFVRSTPALSGGFRIVAHSMGGLIARIYVHKYQAAGKVDRVVTLGSPHMGAQSALAPLIEGMGPIENLLAGGKKVVQRVAFSLPSMYEVLPFYPNCCLQETIGGAPVSVDLLDPSTWDGLSWLPETERAPEQRAFRKESLRRARDLKELYNRGYPEGTVLYPIAGTLISTRVGVKFSPSGAFSTWREGPGDGTVPLFSAFAQLPDQVRIAIRKHSTIFDDRHVRAQLASLLRGIDAPTPFADYSLVKESALQRSGNRRELARVVLEPEEKICALGTTNRFHLELLDSGGNRIDDVAIVAYLRAPGSSQTPQVEVTEPSPGGFEVRVLADCPGEYRVYVTVPGVASGEFEESFISTEEGLN